MHELSLIRDKGLWWLVVSPCVAQMTKKATTALHFDASVDEATVRDWCVRRLHLPMRKLSRRPQLRSVS